MEQLLDKHVPSLQSAPLFGQLPDKLVEAIAGSAKETRLLAGEWLFRQGDPPNGFYVVLTGRLEVVLENPDLVRMRVLGAGSVLGELALLTHAPRSASVRALRDSQLLLVTRAGFDRLLEKDRSFADVLIHLLAAELQVSRGLDA